MIRDVTLRKALLSHNDCVCDSAFLPYLHQEDHNEEKRQENEQIHVDGQVRVNTQNSTSFYVGTCAFLEAF